MAAFFTRLNSEHIQRFAQTVMSATTIAIAIVESECIQNELFPLYSNLKQTFQRFIGLACVQKATVLHIYKRFSRFERFQKCRQTAYHCSGIKLYKFV